jgi:uncharacterized protein YbbK (DUF523 family)
MKEPKPLLVISSCLIGDKVRYDGTSATSNFALSLSPWVRLITLCPELEMGLGVPRDKIILYKRGEQWGISQPSTGRELTERLLSLTDFFLKKIKRPDGFLLKSRSPSCGVSGTKFYADPKGSDLIGRGSGIFAREVINRFPHAPVEDEERIARYPGIRLRFLVALFGGRRQGPSYQALKKMKLPEVRKLAEEVVPRKLLEDWGLYP